MVAKKEKNNSVKTIKCKNKVSKNPENDYIITGSFTFKNKNLPSLLQRND